VHRKEMLVKRIFIICQDSFPWMQNFPITKKLLRWGKLCHTVCQEQMMLQRLSSSEDMAMAVGSYRFIDNLLSGALGSFPVPYSHVSHFCARCSLCEVNLDFEYIQREFKTNKMCGPYLFTICYLSFFVCLKSFQTDSDHSPLPCPAQWRLLAIESQA
jgi:hypothetical protein